jgi:hypothetical protein
MATLQIRTNHQAAREIEAAITPKQVDDLATAAELLRQALELTDQAAALLEPIHETIGVVLSVQMLQGLDVPDDVGDQLLGETPYGVALDLAWRTRDRLSDLTR